MDPLSISTASGMRARLESLEMLANNLANAGTGGYKSDREFYSLYTAPEAADAAADGFSTPADTAPVIESHWTDHSQGVLQTTGNPLNFALSGKGFFTVAGPRGDLYTRNGSFQIDSQGVLSTEDGFPVKTTDGKDIQTQSSSPVTVAADGTAYQDGQALGQLQLVSFANPAFLSKQGSNYFYNPDPQVKPAASDAAVHQGSLESSNSGGPESAVRLVSIMRQFEMLQKAMTLGNEMNRRAIEEVAKVS